VGARERGGLVIRSGGPRGPLLFIPADVALRQTALSALTAVPGARPPARGIALADGELVTVLELPAPDQHEAQGEDPSGDERPLPGADRAVLCVLGGLHVALIGGTVLATGMFEEAEDGVLFRSERARTLDVRALYAQAESAIWKERAASWRPRPPRDDEDEGS